MPSMDITVFVRLESSGGSDIDSDPTPVTPKAWYPAWDAAIAIWRGCSSVLKLYYSPLPCKCYPIKLDPSEHVKEAQPD